MQVCVWAWWFPRLGHWWARPHSPQMGSPLDLCEPLPMFRHGCCLRPPPCNACSKRQGGCPLGHNTHLPLRTCAPADGDEMPRYVKPTMGGEYGVLPVSSCHPTHGLLPQNVPCRQPASSLVTHCFWGPNIGYIRIPQSLPMMCMTPVANVVHVPTLTRLEHTQMPARGLRFVTPTPIGCILLSLADAHIGLQQHFRAAQGCAAFES